MHIFLRILGSKRTTRQHFLSFLQYSYSHINNNSSNIICNGAPKNVYNSWPEPPPRICSFLLPPKKHPASTCQWSGRLCRGQSIYHWTTQRLTTDRWCRPAINQNCYYKLQPVCQPLYILHHSAGWCKNADPKPDLTRSTGIFSQLSAAAVHHTVTEQTKVESVLAQRHLSMIPPHCHKLVLRTRLSTPLPLSSSAVPGTNKVHSKLKRQNSKTFKDLKLQFSSTKSIDKKTYHTRATSKFRVKYILWCTVVIITALMIKENYWHLYWHFVK